MYICIIILFIRIACLIILKNHPADTSIFIQQYVNASKINPFSFRVHFNTNSAPIQRFQFTNIYPLSCVYSAHLQHPFPF